MAMERVGVDLEEAVMGFIDFEAWKLPRRVLAGHSTPLPGSRTGLLRI